MLINSSTSDLLRRFFFRVLSTLRPLRRANQPVTIGNAPLSHLLELSLACGHHLLLHLHLPHQISLHNLSLSHRLHLLHGLHLLADLCHLHQASQVVTTGR